MSDPAVYHVARSREKNWEAAEELTAFTFPWTDAEPPATRFRAFWPDDCLHFRFVVDDPDLVLDESPDPSQAVLGSDRAELFFATDRELSGHYYGLEMDPRGGVYEYRARHYREIDDSWTMPGLVVEGRRREGGYEVVGEIPLDVLRDLDCLRNGRMVTGVYRAEFSHAAGGRVDEDWIAWVDPRTESPDFHVASSFGCFVFES